MKYQDSANLLYKVKEDIFGNPGLDASNLKILCEEISQRFSTFYFKFKGDIDNKFCSLFFATAGMKEEYKHNYNLLILDTTFGTNRFKMPLMVESLVNNMGQTVICFFALISEETTLQFQWVFDCFMECFLVPPINIITDECRSFQSAIKIKFPDSEHFLCSWYKTNNIIKQLSQKGCYRKIKGKLYSNSFFNI